MRPFVDVAEAHQGLAGTGDASHEHENASTFALGLGGQLLKEIECPGDASGQCRPHVRERLVVEDPACRGNERRKGRVGAVKPSGEVDLARLCQRHQILRKRVRAADDDVVAHVATVARGSEEEDRHDGMTVTAFVVVSEIARVRGRLVDPCLGHVARALVLDDHDR